MELTKVYIFSVQCDDLTNVCILCKMITTINLSNMSTTSRSYCVCVCVCREYFRFTLLANFKNTHSIIDYSHHAVHHTPRACSSYLPLRQEHSILRGDSSGIYISLSVDEMLIILFLDCSVLGRF